MALPPRLKSLWQYLCDNCDQAGVWDPNYALASVLIGEPVSPSDLAAFGDRIKTLKSGKIMVVSFIEFQYGKLSTDCRAHIPVFRALEKHRVSIGYPKGIHTLKEEEQEEEQEQGGDARGGNGIEFPPELDTTEFRGAWAEFTAYRTDRKLPKLKPVSINAKFREMATWGEAVAIEQIGATIANGYQGIFPPKTTPTQARHREAEALHQRPSEYGW